MRAIACYAVTTFKTHGRTYDSPAVTRRESVYFWGVAQARVKPRTLQRVPCIFPTASDLGGGCTFIVIKNSVCEKRESLVSSSAFQPHPFLVRIQLDEAWARAKRN